MGNVCSNICKEPCAIFNMGKDKKDPREHSIIQEEINSALRRRSSKLPQPLPHNVLSKYSRKQRPSINLKLKLGQTHKNISYGTSINEKPTPTNETSI